MELFKLALSNLSKQLVWPLPTHDQTRVDIGGLPLERIVELSCRCQQTVELVVNFPVEGCLRKFSFEHVVLVALFQVSLVLRLIHDVEGVKSCLLELFTVFEAFQPE